MCAGRGVHRLALPGRGTVAQAVVRRAEVRAALDHLAREAFAVPRRWRAARFLVLGRREPVARPLPDVAAHVVEPVAVRREAADRRGALEAVLLQVLPRELALPGVRHRPAVREVLVAPGEGRPVEAAAGGVLPLGLGRKLLARPGRVGLRVLVGDLHDGMPVAAVDRRARPARLLPERARHVLPPAADVVQRHGAGGLAEDERARHEQVGLGVRVVGGVERAARRR